MTETLTRGSGNALSSDILGTGGTAAGRENPRAVHGLDEENLIGLAGWSL